MEIEGSLPHSQEPAQRYLWIIRNMVSFCGEELLTTSPNPKAGGPPLVDCPQLVVQYIRVYRPYWLQFLMAPRHVVTVFHFSRPFS